MTYKQMVARVNKLVSDDMKPLLKSIECNSEKWNLFKKARENESN